MLAAIGLFCNQAAGQAKSSRDKAKADKAKTERATAKPAGNADAAAEPAPRKWKQLSVDEKLKNNGLAATKICRAEKFETKADQEMLEEYMTRFLLPTWSHLENLRVLPDLRGKLRNQYFKPAKSAEVHDFLSAVVLKFLDKKLARDPDLHPAARINAAVMIGELNAAEPDRPSDAADPYPEALPVLLAIVTDGEQPDFVKTAAMAGVIRQVRGLSDSGVRAQVLAAMLKLTESPPAVGRADAGRAWLRAQAAEVLGMLGSAGKDGSVVKVLGSIVISARNPLRCRCDAANALGLLDYSTVGESISPSKVASALGQLAVDVCAAEARSLDRRRLKSRLAAVSTGLNGAGQGRTGIVGWAAAEPHKAFVEGINGGVKTILDRLEKEEPSLERIQELQSKLEERLKPPAT